MRKDKEVVLSVRVSQTVVDKLQKKADLLSWSRSQFFRFFIEDCLDNMDKESVLRLIKKKLGK